MYPGFVPKASGIPDNTLVATTDLSTGFPPSPPDKEPVDPPPEVPDEPPAPPEPNPYPDDTHFVVPNPSKDACKKSP